MAVTCGASMTRVPSRAGTLCGGQASRCSLPLSRTRAARAAAARGLSPAFPGAGVERRGRHAARSAANVSSSTVTDEVETGANMSDPGLNSWDPTNWVEPAQHNKNGFRVMAIAIAIAVSASRFNVISQKWSAFAHLVAFATVFGSNFWTTFVGGITMYKNLPRQTFGGLQSKLFPKYFQLSTLGLTICLATAAPLLGAGAPLTSGPYVSLGAALAGSVINLFLLEPKATKVMFRRYGLENKQKAGKGEEGAEAEIKALKGEFGKWHGMSSLANLVSLVGLVSHGFWLAMRI